MSAIIGCVASIRTRDVIMDGLQAMEYRGYDSAGALFSRGKGAEAFKALGGVEALMQKIPAAFASAMVGLGHLHWATHCRPSEQNCHPHPDGLKKVWIVHNGVMENHKAFQGIREQEGVCFLSETDSEVLAHLVGRCVKDGLLIPHALSLIMASLAVCGSNAVVAYHENEPDKLFAACNDSPLFVGMRDGVSYVASDRNALPLVKLNPLGSGEIGILSPGSCRIVRDIPDCAE